MADQTLKKKVLGFIGSAAFFAALLIAPGLITGADNPLRFGLELLAYGLGSIASVAIVGIIGWGGVSLLERGGWKSIFGLMLLAIAAVLGFLALDFFLGDAPYDPDCTWGYRYC